MSSRPTSSASASTFPSIRHQQSRDQVSTSVTSRDEGSQAELNEKTSADPTEAVATAAPATKGRWWSWRLQPRTSTAGGDSSDPEKGGKRTERKLVMIGPIYAGCGAAMAACGYKFHSLTVFFFLVFSFFQLKFLSPPKFCSGILYAIQ